MANKNRKINFFYILMIAWAFIIARDLIVFRKNTEIVPYSEFLKFIKNGNVASVVISNEQITGDLKEPLNGKHAKFATVKINDPDLVQKLTDAQVRFESLHESSFLRSLMSWILPVVVMLAFWWFIFGRNAKGTQGSMLSFGKSKAKVYVEKDLKIRFSDVAGVDEAEEELHEIVSFLKNPEKYNRLGGRVPKGTLLVGPPGTGKTLLARAVAGEAKVPFFSINGSEFVEMFVGLGAARVRDLFETARSHAPCIIFIDELDALGKARGVSAYTGSHEEKEQTLNQLLAELDGFDPSQGVVLLAATNRPEILDPALLRSGRFDRQIMIDKPDRGGRAEILKIHLKKVVVSPQVLPETIAGLTAGFSGADLENLVNEAAIFATRRNAKEIEERDFTEAFERIVGGLEMKSRVLSADEKKRVAYHELGHALVSFAFELNETVHKVSIIPRGIGALGYTMRRPIEDKYLVSKEELENKIAVLLGGRASESFFLNGISTGASDDLDKATEIARSMITRFGMSEKLGLLTYDREVAPMLGSMILPHSHDYSEETARTIDQEAVDIVDKAYERAKHAIEKNRKFIENAVTHLIEKETLDEEELEKIWRKYGRKIEAKNEFKKEDDSSGGVVRNLQPV